MGMAGEYQIDVPFLQSPAAQPSCGDVRHQQRAPGRILKFPEEGTFWLPGFPGLKVDFRQPIAADSADAQRLSTDQDVLIFIFQHVCAGLFKKRGQIGFIAIHVHPFVVAQRDVYRRDIRQAFQQRHGHAGIRVGTRYQITGEENQIRRLLRRKAQKAPVFTSELSVVQIGKLKHPQLPCHLARPQRIMGNRQAAGRSQYFRARQ